MLCHLTCRVIGWDVGFIHLDTVQQFIGKLTLSGPQDEPWRLEQMHGWVYAFFAAQGQLDCSQLHSMAGDNKVLYHWQAVQYTQGQITPSREI